MYVHVTTASFFFWKIGKCFRGRMSGRILDSKPYEVFDQKYSIFPSIAAEDLY